MSQLDRAIVVGLGITAWFGAAVLITPDHAALVAHVWLVAILALALAVGVARLGSTVPRRASAFDAAFVPAGPTRARPASLARVEREVTLATGTAFDVQFRLRPIVRDLSAGMLLRRGIDLERSPERASAVLGPEIWELARPDRPVPEDRTAPGLPIADVERVVDELERLACS